MKKRSASGQKSFSPIRFFKDYPIVLVLVFVFLAGVWVGRQTAAWRTTSHQTVKAETYGKISAGTARSTAVSEPVQKPSFFRDFFRGTGFREVRITPAPKKKLPPRIVFVIDDIGYSKQLADLLFSLENSVTLAILPQLQYSKYFAQEGKKHGFETILHLPLEPIEKPEGPKVDLITTKMSPQEVKEELEKDLESVPDVVGVNNHMGSRATQDSKLMSLVASELKKKNLFFLDSRTHPKSIAYATAKSSGIVAFKRDVFIDGQDNSDYIKKQIKRAAQIAKQNGYVIAIGHIHKTTLLTIKEVIPSLKAEGFEISTLKGLVEK